MSKPQIREIKHYTPRVFSNYYPWNCTHFRVTYNGQYINSFLSEAKAQEYARELEGKEFDKQRWEEG